MSDSTGDVRICPSCGSRNKAAHNYCVRCSASLRAGATGLRPVVDPTGAGRIRMLRLLLTGGFIAVIAAGLVVRTVVRATREASILSEDVRADSARTVDAPPPPTVSGWYPGANLPEPDPVPPPRSSVPSRSTASSPTWSADSFPVARPNPYDVPGDPSASMVGIAPRAPRDRAAMARKRVFTEEDLLETRAAGGN